MWLKILSSRKRMLPPESWPSSSLGHSSCSFNFRPSHAHSCGSLVISISSGLLWFLLRAGIQSHSISMLLNSTKFGSSQWWIHEAIGLYPLTQSVSRCCACCARCTCTFLLQLEEFIGFCFAWRLLWMINKKTYFPLISLELGEVQDFLGVFGNLP